MTNDDSTPYDGTYKHLFSHPEMVESLIKDFVQEDWVQELEFSTLEKVNASYVSDDLREREDDIIWRVKWRDSWCYVYLLLEFQSSVDYWMALRIMVYVGLLYQDLIKSGSVKSGELLPPVFPLVLYNGLGPWTAPRNVSDLIAALPFGVACYIPKLGYFLLDESTLSDEELAEADGLASVLFHMDTRSDLEDIRKSVQELIQRLYDKKYQPLRRAFTVWINRILFRRLACEEKNFPELNDLQEVNLMLAERVTQWTQQWMHEGEKRGKIEGKIEGKRLTLESMLRKRFSEQSLAPYADMLLTADSDKLDIWIDRFLEAASIDDIFAP